MKSLKNLILLVVLLVAMGGCSSLPKPENHASKTEWMKAVMEYRREYSEHPEDYEIKMKLKEAEMNASEAFYDDGISLQEQGQLDDAIYQFREGLSAMAENEKIADALKQCLHEKEANTFYQQAVDLDKAGKEDDARNLLKQALSASPDHEGAKALLEKIDTENQEKAGGLVFSSTEPISLHFNHTDLKAVFDFIGKSFGINIIFDDSLKGKEVTLAAENVTFEQALDLILHTTQTFSKQIGPNTILVADDTKSKRDQYDDLLIKNIQLNTVKASDMANLLKSVLDLKHVVVNDSLNTLLIRDTQDVLKLAEEIVAANDRPAAEVLLDVEILEVDRQKEEQLGFNYGNLVTYNWGASPMGVSTIANTNLGDLIGQGNLTLPTVTLNYFKQDVDAKTLAHPQIRALDNKEAKIHIGNRVPLPASVIQQTTGQVQTTYNYTDIGVLLNVTPFINLDRTVLVKLDLEVSSLGANLGTAQYPAYEIGTRDADTTMLLHDGESAILGGLIQDSDSKTKQSIPILGDIPLLGSLFATSSDNSDQRTDILLTITPRIVRDWTFPHKELQEVYSGTQSNLSSNPLFTLFNQKNKGKASKISVGDLEPSAPVAAEGTPTLPFQGSSLANPSPTGGVILSFSQPQYDAVLGQPVIVKLYGENIGKLKEMPLAVAFNSSYLKFVSVTPADSTVDKMETDNDEKHGLIRMKLNLKSNPQAAGPVELAELKLTGYTPGISYLVFLNPAFKDETGADVRSQAKASRISVK